MIDGLPVLDAVVHAYNMDAANYANRFAAPLCDLVYGSVVATARHGYAPTRAQFYRDWSIQEAAEQVFLESDTDLAVYHVLPIFSFKDGLCSLEIYPNSWVGSEIRGWKMDDPEIAFPLFERAEKLGIKVIAVHKALPLGPVPMEHYKVDDIDRACMAFPGLNFEIVHGGMAFLEETAWQLARFDNVYVNLEITSALAASRPAAFLHAMAALIGPGGQHAIERILWGTGAMAFHPQPLLETFVREFAFPEALIEGAGLPQLDLAAKRAILFDNYGRMTGLDLDARLSATRDDEFARRRPDGPLAPFSTVQEVANA